MTPSRPGSVTVELAGRGRPTANGAKLLPMPATAI
jgi:hypothetical protein